MPFEKNPDEIGALWLHSSAKGDYMTGEVSIDGVTTKIVCFRSKSTSPKAPAWNILKSKPKVDMAAPPAGTYNANEDVPF